MDLKFVFYKEFCKTFHLTESNLKNLILFYKLFFNKEVKK